MRVAIFAPINYCIPPEGYRGAEQVVWDLCQGLSELGVDYTLLASYGSRSPNKQYLPTVESVPDATLQDEIRALEKTSHILGGFDVVNDHSHWGMAASFASTLPSTRVVKTFHGIQSLKKLPRIEGDSNLVSLSEWHRLDNLERYGKDSKIVNLGIDVNKYKLNVDKENFYLMPGLITPHKGQLRAIEACKRANVKLIVCGQDSTVIDSEYPAKVKKACKEADFPYLGYVSNEEKVSLLGRAKAVLLPFKIQEAYSLLALEAQACGTPVLTHRVGGVVDLIQEGITGDFCEGEKGLVNSIIDCELGKYSPSDCREFIKQRFTYQDMAEKYFRLYENVYNGAGW